MSSVTKQKTKAGEGQKKTSKKWTLNIRTLALSQPNRFKLTPKYSTPLAAKYYVSKHTLKAKATPRLIALSKPKKITKKFDPIKVMKSVFPVSKTALRVKCSPRTEMLARHVLMKIQNALERYKDRGDYIKINMKKYIDLAEKSMYRDMYWPKPELPPEDPPKVKSCQFKKKTPCPPPKSKSEALAELMQWCNTRSIPKSELPPPPLPPSKKRPLAELKKRLTTLSTPKLINKKYDIIDAGKYKTGVHKHALTYKASSRIQELSKPKPIKDPKPRRPGVAKSALTATASERIKKLSKPRERQQGQNEEKENPYAVKPKALKAYCSERTKQLAKPRKIK